MNTQRSLNQTHSTFQRERFIRLFCRLLPSAVCGLPSLLCLLFFTGCMSALKAPQVDLSALKAPGPVTTVVAAWEPAVSSSENPMRGFGGRVYFYDQEKNRPVKAKGTVVVYAFDEEGRAPRDSKPNEGFVFDEKTLNSKGVYKKSKLGHSYNLWIPWDSAGPEGEARKISLIVRYIPKKGSSAVSKQATVHLPGRRDYTMTASSESRTIQEVLAPPTTLTEERIIDSNVNRPLALQAVTIK